MEVCRGLSWALHTAALLAAALLAAALLAAAPLALARCARSVAEPAIVPG